MKHATQRILGVLAGLTMLVGTAAWAGPGPGGKVDLNAATVEQLATLPGIGPAKAEAIVAHRAKAPFRTSEELQAVKGVGPKLYESLKDHITVGEAAPPAGRGS